jgi:hypothetical protein
MKERFFMHDAITNSTVEPLILDLLDWLAIRERTYEEVMDVWRTSCPRLTVWEDANERGLVSTEQRAARQIVVPTAAGLSLLEKRGHASR